MCIRMALVSTHLLMFTTSYLPLLSLISPPSGYRWAPGSAGPVSFSLPASASSGPPQLFYSGTSSPRQKPNTAAVSSGPGYKTGGGHCPKPGNRLDIFLICPLFCWFLLKVEELSKKALEQSGTPEKVSHPPLSSTSCPLEGRVNLVTERGVGWHSGTSCVSNP